MQIGKDFSTFLKLPEVVSYGRLPIYLISYLEQIGIILWKPFLISEKAQ